MKRLVPVVLTAFVLGTTLSSCTREQKLGAGVGLIVAGGATFYLADQEAERLTSNDGQPGLMLSLPAMGMGLGLVMVGYGGWLTWKSKKLACDGYWNRIGMDYSASTDLQFMVTPNGAALAYRF